MKAPLQHVLLVGRLLEEWSSGLHSKGLHFARQTGEDVASTTFSTFVHLLLVLLGFIELMGGVSEELCKNMQAQVAAHHCEERG